MNDEATVPSAVRPLALYVHMPWCVSKCPYCDFNSHALQGTLPEHDYLCALFEDLDCEAALLGGRAVSSVFIGGGTPSLFGGEAMTTLLRGVRDRLTLEPDAEITLEANPGAADRQRFAAYRAAGVNRLSIGAQSFAADKLRRLGRVHDPDAIRAAVAAARAAGFDNFNLDLMFGLPTQTVEQALADVDAALTLAPTHLSHYQLTLEPNTRFHHAPPPLPDDELTWEMQQRCGERLAAAGFERYEVSAWALPGRRCRHNLNYWRFGDYAGIGAGAHGKLTLQRGVLRREKIAHPRSYMLARAGADRLARERRPTPAELRFEYLLNALRLTEGFTLGDLALATSVAAAPLLPALRAAQRHGLLRCAGEHWCTTPLGWRFLDTVLEDFLPESVAC